MDSDVINVRDQLAVVRRRWRVVVVCVLLATAAAVAFTSLQRPMFSADAEVLISPVGAVEDRGNVLDPEEIATQIEVITSHAVAKEVRSNLDLEATASDLLESVTVEPVDDTRVLLVGALRGSSEEAADVANAFAEAYLQRRAARSSIAATATIESLQSRYDEVSGQLRELQTQIQLAGVAERGALEAEAQALTVQLTTLLSDLANAQTLTEGDQSGGHVLIPASAPTSEANLNLVPVGVALGLMLGIGLAFVREHFDDAVRDEVRLRTAVGTAPVLGRVPRWPGARSGRLVTMVNPRAPASEAYRSLSSSVRFLLAPAHDRAGDDRHRTLLVTSAAPGEGKTTVASNLAVAAARFGLRVVLVDADLRKPGVAEAFGLGRPPGLSDLLADGGDVAPYLLDVGVDGLQVLPAGSTPPNPAELLASEASIAVVQQLRARADLVIIDSAPVGRVADTRELVPSLDLVLLTVRRGVTRLRTVGDAVERIRQVGGTVSGVVFNDVGVRGEENSYGYGYGYGPEATAGDQPRVVTRPAEVALAGTSMTSREGYAGPR